ncbi:ABC transporter substrate-binding protein [Clostridium sp. DL1XJH146]
MKRFKSYLSVLLVGLMVFVVSACGNNASENNSANNNASNDAAVESEEGTEEVLTQYPLTVVDSFDREITIDEEPTTIVSIAPNITEIVAALDAEDKLIGRTDYCDFPTEISEVESIGSITEPNVERIVELDPDVVIASTPVTKEVVDQIEELGLKIIVLSEEQNFDGAYEEIIKVGEVVNKKVEAEEIVSGMKTKYDEVVAKVKDLEKPSVYYVVGFGQYGDFTATGDTYIHPIIEAAGGENIAAEDEGWGYSLEKLVEKDPEIIICSQYFDTKAGIEATDGYKDLSAVVNGKLLEIDNNMIDRQGPRLIDGLEAMAKLIHPEAF